MIRGFNQWPGIEDVENCAVRPSMKTKHLFGLVAVVATVGLASSAQAGVSISFNLGLPVPVFHAPRSVVVYTPPCPPPAVHCPPVVVYQPVPRCAPVVYVAPRYERHDNYRDQRGYYHRRNGREERGYGHDSRGQERGGRR
jgi:hypothetical protein